MIRNGIGSALKTLGKDDEGLYSRLLAHGYLHCIAFHGNWGVIGTLHHEGQVRSGLSSPWAKGVLGRTKAAMGRGMRDDSRNCEMMMKRVHAYIE